MAYDGNWFVHFSVRSPRGIMYGLVGARKWLKRRGPVPLEITQRETNRICLLTLKGRLVLGEESNGLRTTIDNLLLSGVTKIVISLEQVNYVDSAGLGALIEIHRKTKAKGARLMLTNLGPKLRQALELAGLLTIFETCATEADGIARF